ncbi:prepilin-type N-terminal cleavage/methylation domain-containing protein [Clostridium sp. B9]|uniref:prepilin-type N-terminal cleavage/methylation domain-containing protein n=1 Tax=Clostridium sp. B9 TaxID=3423224 RepID=UPI003D2EF1A5
MYKNKGFTLNELIVYLGVMSLVVSLPTGFLVVRERGYELKVENDINLIHSFLMEVKQLSRNDNSYGEITIDSIGSEFIYKNKERMAYLKLENVKVMNNMNGTIAISNMGMIKTAGTLTIIDKNNRQKKITIEVATGKVNVK